MTPDNELTTPRLTLRLIQADESHVFASAIRRSPSLYPWLDWCHAHFSDNEASDFLMHTRLNWVKNESFGFGVYLRKTQEFVGMVALTDMALNFNMGTIGFWICDKFQRQGYAQEAIGRLIRFCFEDLQLTRLECICDPENTASHQLTLACGAVKECLARNRYLFNGSPKDGVVFSFVPE
ncbi:MAG: GNAT family N-acetyltransferase [Vibrio sp.]